MIIQRFAFDVAAVLILAYVMAASPVAARDNRMAKTDAEIRQLLIEESISMYPGNCPCPYNLMSNGRSCGRRSAWSRAGGYAPLCYEEDVTQEQVEAWRRRRQGELPPIRGH